MPGSGSPSAKDKIMRVTYDKEADALYIGLKRGRIKKTIEKDESFLIDVDAKGDVVGFEILNYSKAVPQKEERLSITTETKKIPIPA